MLDIEFRCKISYVNSKNKYFVKGNKFSVNNINDFYLRLIAIFMICRKSIVSHFIYYYYLLL